MRWPVTLEERPLPGTDLWAMPSGWPQGVLPASLSLSQVRCTGQRHWLSLLIHPLPKTCPLQSHLQGSSGATRLASPILRLHLSLLLLWGPGIPHMGVPVGASTFLTSFPLSKPTGSSSSRAGWLADWTTQASA